jgi:hypothetical protein
LAARVKGFDLAGLYREFAAERLVLGTSIRRTLHVVDAAEHASYAAVAAAGGVDDWWPSPATRPEPAVVRELRGDLRTFARQTRTAEQLVAFVEEWVRANANAFDDAGLAAQRQYKWRPLYTWTALARVPADGVWSARTPNAYRAVPDAGQAGTAAALDALIRCHLRAFGPAAAEDIATWIGLKVPPVRAALAGMALEPLRTDGGRTLYDLPDAPRPDPATPAPVRLLPSFDSTLLAYAHKHRQRILPDEHRAAVYLRANLRIRPTILVDGFVAGTWTVTATRRTARLTVTPLGPWDKATGAAVTTEAGRMLSATHPSVPNCEVTIDA